MRIISNYHDYYDSLQKIDDERDVVWIRNEEVIELNDDPFPKIRTMSYIQLPPFRLSRTYLGFCGRIIPIVKFRYANTDRHQVMEYNVPYYCYSTDQVSELVDKLSKKELRKVNNKSYFCNWKDYSNDVFSSKPDVLDWFVKYSTPSFLLRKRDWNKFQIVKNPCLKDLTFYTQYDTMQTYQEIAMFFSGVLGDVNEKIPPISNNDMIQAKGFDLKESFRKPKQKRK